MYKICSACGKEIQSSVKFCPYCGTDVREESGSVSSTESNFIRRRRIRNILVISLGIIISGIAIAIILVPKPQTVQDIRQISKPNPIPQPVEKRLPTIAEIKTELIKLTRQYYENIGSNDFEASTYYAPRVDRYYNRENLVPDDIDNLYYDGFYPEFRDPEFRFNESTFRLREIGNNYELSFEGIFTCYRNSKQKYQFSRVKTIIIYNQDYKIKSISEENVWDVRYSNSR